MKKDTLPLPYDNVPLMRSTFMHRTPDLPQLITYGGAQEGQSDLDSMTLIGPFCAHCGNPEMYHSTPNRRCPRAQLFNLLPLPQCGCHGTPEQARREGRDPRTGRKVSP